MTKDLLLEAYVGMLKETAQDDVSQIRSGSSPTASAIPPRTPNNPSPQIVGTKNNSLDTILDATSLVDFLHYIREYFYTLPPDQQDAMCNYLRDNMSPEE